jgi:hypothetical protein
LDIPSSSQCSSTICAADFPLTNLQPHKSALPISPTVGMAASPLGPVFNNMPKCAPRALLTLLHTAFYMENSFRSLKLIIKKW